MARTAAIPYRFVGDRARRFASLVAAADRVGYALLDRNRTKTPPLRSLAVIQPSGLGDILMTLPVLKLLKDAWGGRIVMAVSPGAVSWLKTCPFVDEVLPIDISPLFGSGKGTTGALLRQLRAIKADAIYEMRGDIRLTALLRAAHPLARLGGFTCGGGGFLLDRAFDYSLDDHIATMYRVLLGEVGIDADPLDDWNPAWMPVEAPDVDLPPDYVAIHVGCGETTNRWPKERLVEVAQALARDRPVVLLGAPGDLTPEFHARFDAIEGVLNLVGRLSFGQSLYATAHSALFVGQDTGSTHGAALLGRPFVALYGGFNNQRFMPVLLRPGQGIVLQNRPACSREHGCARRTCADNICMSSITVASVLQAVANVAEGAVSGGAADSHFARGTASLPEAEAVRFSTTLCRDI